MLISLSEKTKGEDRHGRMTPRAVDDREEHLAILKQQGQKRGVSFARPTKGERRREESEPHLRVEVLEPFPEVEEFLGGDQDDVESDTRAKAVSLLKRFI